MGRLMPWSLQVTLKWDLLLRPAFRALKMEIRESSCKFVPTFTAPYDKTAQCFASVNIMPSLSVLMDFSTALKDAQLFVERVTRLTEA